MQLIDWLIVVLYLVVTLWLGIAIGNNNTPRWLKRFISPKSSTESEVNENKSAKYEDKSAKYLVADRKLTWWLAGTSMAATTFSIDTPLYVCGIVATRGIAGNWEWWSFGISHIILIYLFSRSWRRSEVTTDAELTKLRYGGKTADILRGTKAFLFAVPINCIGIGYAMLAMVKVIDALQLWQSLGVDPAENLKIWSVVGVSVFVLIYCGISGLMGVVITDFFQFFLALFGAFIVAIIAVNHVGGIQPLLTQVQSATSIDVLSFVPLTKGEGLMFEWSDIAGITASTFSAYLFVQWWSFRRSDGGGEFVQRLLGCKDEAEAEKAAWFFNLMQYIVRTWPWILVALVAIILYPDLSDPELGYPKLMLDFLPPAILGLVVASLIAAFMSTVSTSINWGASYIANDLYVPLAYPPSVLTMKRRSTELSQIKKFRPLNPTEEQEERELQASLEPINSKVVKVAQIASIIVTAFGALAAFYAKDITVMYRLVIAIGTGPGLVLILRWFWWRINAAAELAAMVGGFLVGLITMVVPQINELLPDFGIRLMVISLITSVFWITAMLLTPPEDETVLKAFYDKVKPSGFWQFTDDLTLNPAQNLPQDILRTIAATLILFGGMFSIGGFLLLQSFTGWISLIIMVIGGFWLRKINGNRWFRKDSPALNSEFEVLLEMQERE